MKTYKIGMVEISANNKKEAVEKYIIWHFDSRMYKCEKSFKTLYKNAKEI